MKTGTRHIDLSVPGGWQAGQSTVEFMLMIVVIMLVSLAVMTIAFLGSQVLTMRYLAYAGARGNLAYSGGFGDGWRQGVEQLSDLMILKVGQPQVAGTGDGASVSLRVRELFPGLRFYGGGSEFELSTKAELGREPVAGGDNYLDQRWIQ